MHRRSIITVAAMATLLVSLWPGSAHAWSLADIGGSFLSYILSFVADVLQMIRGLLIEFIAVLGTLLNAVINQPELNYGGAAVYTIWKIFRDICNLLFIVIFIFISFGTIFNVLKKNALHYSSALRGVIVAAIVINFSLAIGQTVVWAGNFATGMALKLISGKNVGAQIATALQIPQIVMGQQGVPVSAIPDTVTPLDQQDPIQRITSAGFTGNAKTAFENCQKFNQQPTVGGCTALATRIQATQNAAAVDYEISRLNQSPSLKSRLKDAYSFWSNAARGAVKGATSGPASYVPGGAAIGAAIGAWNGATLGPQPKEAAKLTSAESAQKILSLLLNVFLLLVVTLSFCTVIIFMVIRIPMVWLLLSFSSLAFFSSAWPGSGALKKWFNNLLGWCIFSPLYLLVIYVGLFLMSQQDTLLAGMKNAAFFSGAFGIILFYVMTAAIFIGGAGYAMKYAFGLSSSAGAAFGRIGGIMGVSEKSRFGIDTLAGGLGRVTGAAAYGEAAAARARQAGEDITAAARGRFPALLRTEEEAKALAKARFGVRGGAAEFAKLSRGRIETEQKNIEIEQREQLQKLQNARAQAQTDEERSALDGRIKKLKEAQTAELKRKMVSGNRDVRLAASELLMNSGKLSAQDLQKLGTQYQNISPDALAGFIERRDRQLLKDAEKRTYTKGKEAEEMAAALALIADPKEANKYIEAAGKGKNKFWALEAGTNRKLIMGPDGKPMSMEYAVTERADQFNATDLVHAESYYHQRGEDMPEQLKNQFERSLLSPNRLAQMSRNASNDLDQLARIYSAVDRVSKEVAEKQFEVRQLTNDITKALKENRADDARSFQAQLDIARERLDELKRPIKDQKAKEEKEAPKKEEKSGGDGGKKAK